MSQHPRARLTRRDLLSLGEAALGTTVTAAVVGLAIDNWQDAVVCRRRED